MHRPHRGHLVLILLQGLAIFNVECQSNSSLATAVVNTNILTVISYANTQIYVYGALANDNQFRSSPQRWIFYYVPIAMIPVERFYDESVYSKWMWTVKERIKVKFALANDIITKKVREAIKRKYSKEINQFSESWDVSPLMIDSLTAYIVEVGSGEAAPGVQPYHVVHPHGLTVTATFYCSQERVSQEVLQRIFDSEYEIRVAFVFAGFRQITTNLVSASIQNVKDAFTKTVADSGDDKAEFIHRSQMNKFLEKCLTNVQLMTYSEGRTESSSVFGTGELLLHFSSLFSQGILKSVMIDVDESSLFQQIWSNDDLKPDVLTHELNKVFDYNKEQSAKHENNKKIFSFNSSSTHAESVASKFGVSFLRQKLAGISANAATSGESQNDQSSKSVISLEELKNAFSQKDTHIEWTGSKLIVKKFKVYKLSDLKNELRANIFAKQLTAERTTGTIVRILVYYDNKSQIYKSSDKFPYFPGMVYLYSGKEEPPLPWLVCNGTAVSRKRFPQLFESIGTKYGTGDDKETFNLPDFRSRLPLGADPAKIHSEIAQEIGQVGGEAWHTLTVSELPTHSHSAGTLKVSETGTHRHDVNDTGHKHFIDEEFFATIDGDAEPQRKGTRKGFGEINSKDSADSDYYHFHIPTSAEKIKDYLYEHFHKISKGFTNIKIENGGEHKHSVSGTTTSIGSNKRMNLIGPYQVLRFIIYSGKIS